MQHTRQIDIATILYDIDIDAENTDSYNEIFEDHDLGPDSKQNQSKLKQPN